MPTLSAVIITFNEERNIGRCLDSVMGIADEVVVVDSFSTDRTGDICRSYGVKFLQHAFEGYVEQKNHATGQASGDYVLSLDADEALSPELRTSILRQKEHLEADGYSMNRLTQYCGKWIRHCGWYPDTKIRLFKKGKGCWEGMNPHDRYTLAPGVKPVFLDGDLLHYSFYSVKEHKEQARKFAAISAEAMYKRGIRSNSWKMAAHPLAKFLRNYVIHRGFLDGYYGLLICLISAKATYRKYKKLAALGNQKT